MRYLIVGLAALWAGAPWYHALPVPIRVPAQADVELRAASGAANNAVHGELDMALLRRP